MKKKLLIGTLSTVMSLGFLSACNAGNNQMNDPEGVNYSPVRYDQVDNNRGTHKGINDSYRNKQNDTNNKGLNNRGNNNQRFDGDRNRINDMMDRGESLDRNDNNRNN